MKQIRTYLICTIALILVELFFLVRNGVDISKSALGLYAVSIVFIVKAIQLTVKHERQEKEDLKKSKDE